jgi:glycosyltransferase involved in cell wall biosynthesis
MVARDTRARPTRPGLLCLSQSFSPETTPTAIRAGKLLERLDEQWRISVLTEAPHHAGEGHLRVEVVNGWRPRRLLGALRRLRLDKLLELALWPDDSIFWVLPAILAGLRVVKEEAPEAIVVFMMPYSAGLAGLALSRLTGLPLILNLDDSPTCTDMHPRFPTRLHYRLAIALEDAYARHADAIVYVSQTNLDAARARQQEPTRQKYHLVRYGADRDQTRRPPERETDSQPPPSPRLEIAYVGAMTGWWALIRHDAEPGPLRRLYDAWNRLGSYELVRLDHRTASPAVIGRAIMETIAAHPDWRERIHMTVYGNPYSHEVVSRALASAGVQEVVTVLDPVPHDQVADIINDADLLFITLPTRLDGSRGGRISAKTYEYLMTDRPILAAVPRGENWDYLSGKPGVWLVEPNDHAAMSAVIAELAAAKLSGRPVAFAREDLQQELSYEVRAREFAAVIAAGVEHRRARGVAGRRRRAPRPGGSRTGGRHRSPR